MYLAQHRALQRAVAQCVFIDGPEEAVGRGTEGGRIPCVRRHDTQRVLGKLSTENHIRTGMEKCL